MDLADQATRFRAEVARLGRRSRGHPYPEELRRSAVKYLRGRRREGATATAAAKELGDLVVGVWDGFSVTDGHALLVTRRHLPTSFDATQAEQRELVAAAAIARAEIERRFPCTGFNIGINVCEAAGQTVPHLHVHVIPRRQGDVADPRDGVRHVLPVGQGSLEAWHRGPRAPPVAGRGK